MTHIINSSVLSSEKKKSIKSALETEEELCDMAFVVPHSTRHQMVYGYP